MPYTFVTLTQAETDLSNRLFDPTQQFWTASELGVYLTEALQTWNALTSVWRADFTFALVSGQYWYDLTTLSGTPRPITVTDNQVTQVIEYHLLEPLTTSYPLTWTGSAQFSVSDILGALQRRRDEVLSVTGCQLTQSLIAWNSGSTVALSDSIIDVRRVAWFPSVTYPVTPLFSSDFLEKEFFAPGWGTATTGAPEVWFISTEPPLVLGLDTATPVNSNLDVVTVNAGPALSTTSATTLGVPDDWAWVIKWGALASLLSRESNSKDEFRAKYAQQRYKDGLTLLSNASALLDLRFGTAPFDIDPVTNGDQFNPGWQGLVAGAPVVAYVAGLNLIAFNQPGFGSYNISATVVQNAPVVISGNLQISRQDYHAILDYAQHLATFKIGGAEFAKTFPLAMNFYNQAKLYNSKLAQLGVFQLPMYETSQTEFERNPTYNREVLNG